MKPDEMFAEIVPERSLEWFADHPRVLHALCLGLFGFAAYNFYRACELVIRARDLIGATQAAVSEGLGG